MGAIQDLLEKECRDKCLACSNIKKFSINQTSSGATWGLLGSLNLHNQEVHIHLSKGDILVGLHTPLAFEQYCYNIN